MAKAQSAKKQPRKPEAYSWLALQEVLRGCETSEQVQVILQDEIKLHARLRWMLRINGRLTALRQEEEVAYLESVARS